MYVYADGSLLSSGVTHTGSIKVTTHNLGIGLYGGAGWRFNGLIDEVGLYDSALTSSEVLARYYLGIKNSTTAGSATANAASSTSIDISMPYTDDDNGDSTYKVEYKENSSGTWLDWGTNPKSHSATPYTDTKTGLTTGTAYDVRLTYIDSDGITGTAVQTVTSITPNFAVVQVSYWNLDEDSGSTAVDSIGSNNCTISGATTSSVAISNNSRSYNGSSDYLSCGNDASLNIANEITIEAWIKTGVSKDQIIVAKHFGTTNGSYYLSTLSTGKIRLSIINSSSTRVDLDRTFSYNDDAWHHIVGTYDGSNMYVYADGSLLSSGVSHTGSIKVTTYDLGIGAYSGANWRFNGLIDEVGLYDSALTSSEVLARYNLGL